MTKREVIELLERYPHIGDEIEYWQSSLQDLEDNIGPSAPVIDGQPHGKGLPDPTRVEALAIDGDLMRTIEAEIESLKALQQAVFNAVKRLPYYPKMVVYYYYFDGRPWAWVARELNYSREQCMRLRGLAVDVLQKIF